MEGGKQSASGATRGPNTNSGLYSAGRLHGFGLVHEAVRQLRGAAATARSTRPK